MQIILVLFAAVPASIASYGVAFEIVQTNGDLKNASPEKTENILLNCTIVSSMEMFVWKKQIDLSVQKRNKLMGQFKNDRLRNESTYGSISSVFPIRTFEEGQHICKSLRNYLDKLVNVIKPYQSYQTKDTQEQNSQSIPEMSNWYNFEWNREIQPLPTEINRFLKESQSHYYEYDYNNKKKGFSYAGVTAAVLAIILIAGALFYRLMKRFDVYAQPPSEQMSSEMEPTCHHPTCGQYCTFPASDSHHEAVRLPCDGPNLLPIVVMPSYADTVCLPINDLPPSYDHFAKASDLPPSYNEAVRAMSVFHVDVDRKDGSRSLVT